MENLINNHPSEEIIKGWVELYSDKMYSWALFKTSNKEIAEDLVQDTFMVVCQSLEKFEGRSDPKTWLYAILNRKIALHFRNIYKEKTDTEGERYVPLLGVLFDSDDEWAKEERPKNWQDEPDNLLDDKGFVQVLNSCMSKLPEKWNVALQLKYMEEKKGELICQELEIAPTNFWQILHRAKLQLRKCLEMAWFKRN